MSGSFNEKVMRDKARLAKESDDVELQYRMVVKAAQRQESRAKAIAANPELQNLILRDRKEQRMLMEESAATEQVIAYQRLVNEAYQMHREQVANGASRQVS